MTDAIEQYEALAEAFYKDTGYIAPGKDDGGVNSYDERDAAWNTWLRLRKDRDTCRREASEWRKRAEAAEAECLEQARLNGMGASREAALMADRDRLSRELEEEKRRTKNLLDETELAHGMANAALTSRDEARDKLAIAVKALESIRANTCCGSCQEAALVAQSALANIRHKETT